MVFSVWKDDLHKMFHHMKKMINKHVHYTNVLIQQILLYLEGKAVLLWIIPGVTRTLKKEHH